MFFDPNEEYLMPGFFGPTPRKVTGRKYNDVSPIAISSLNIFPRPLRLVNYQLLPFPMLATKALNGWQVGLIT